MLCYILPVLSLKVLLKFLWCILETARICPLTNSRVPGAKENFQRQYEERVKEKHEKSQKEVIGMAKDCILAVCPASISC